MPQGARSYSEVKETVDAARLSREYLQARPVVCAQGGGGVVTLRAQSVMNVRSLGVTSPRKAERPRAADDSSKRRTEVIRSVCVRSCMVPE